MVQFYNNLSPTTKLVLQSFLAVLLSVLAGVAVAAYQSYTSAGTMDLQALINVCLVTFALLFGKAMHDWVPAHAQQLLKAADEEKAMLYDALQSAQIVANQAQNQPVQLAPAHVQAISKQIALNLTTMAAEPAKAPPTPQEAPYVDPLKVSAVLPAYTPPVAIANQATQRVPVPQVPFPGQAV
jgi:hypothetical protein